MSDTRQKLDEAIKKLKRDIYAAYGATMLDMPIEEIKELIDAQEQSCQEYKELMEQIAKDLHIYSG